MASQQNGIFGIIAEFNPFHRGHAALLHAARQAGAQQIAVVMSGDFVQRGGPALFSKWARAEMALRCGADAVFELPLPWAMAGAERFAEGGAFLLSQIGCGTICFGSECGDAQALGALAQLLLSEPFSLAVKRELAKGLSFAAARERAVRALAGNDAADLLREPNNTLAVEYLKACRRLGLAMQPFTVTRTGPGHHDETSSGSLASATAIRGRMLRGENWHGLMPPQAEEIARRELARGAAPADPVRMERALLACLRSLPRDAFARLPDVSEGLENRLFAASRQAGTAEAFFRLAKTKRYPLARLRRIAYSALLGLRAEHAAGLPPYLRLLGFRAEAAPLLRQAKRTGKLPFCTHSSDLLHLDKTGRIVVELEGKGCDLHALFCPFPAPCGQDLSHGVIRL